jgi:restriction system protein
MSPKGFENFAAFLLRKAGFTEVNVTGKTNDVGIDGIGYLRINPMMTTSVLFQCKRYADKPIDKDEIMKLQAAVLRERAEKGLYLKTSSFTKSAKEEAIKGAKEIELIETMKLGLKEKTIFVVDVSFFEEYDSDK